MILDRAPKIRGERRVSGVERREKLRVTSYWLRVGRLATRDPQPATDNSPPVRPPLEPESNRQHPSQECAHNRHDHPGKNLPRLETFGFPLQENRKDKAPNDGDLGIGIPEIPTAVQNQRFYRLTHFRRRGRRTLRCLANGRDAAGKTRKR
jgi:hypothetical protein